MVNKFLEYLEFEKRYSKHTVVSYKTDLLQFQTYLSVVFDLNTEDATHVMIRSWMVALVENGISSRTINRKKTTLQVFYKYLKSKEFIEETPMQKVVAPKVEKRLPHYVKKQDMEFQKTLLQVLNYQILHSSLAEYINQNIDIAHSFFHL